jgi:hypothetical protein
MRALLPSFFHSQRQASGVTRRQLTSCEGVRIFGEVEDQRTIPLPVFSLCVLKTRFGNSGDEVRRGQVVM